MLDLPLEAPAAAATPFVCRSALRNCSEQDVEPLKKQQRLHDGVSMFSSDLQSISSTAISFSTSARSQRGRQRKLSLAYACERDATVPASGSPLRPRAPPSLQRPHHDHCKGLSELYKRHAMRMSPSNQPLAQACGTRSHVNHRRNLLPSLVGITSDRAFEASRS